MVRPGGRCDQTRLTQVVSVNNGVCELDYKGPKAIAMGVAAAIKDQFLDIKEVKFNMEESDSDTDAPKQ